jgi:hypothetical protein
MKPIKVTLLFLAIILNLVSCETIRTRNSHSREIRAKLDKYSDVLDLARTEIYFEGGVYYLLGSEPTVYLSLYVKPDHNNREMLFYIRDELIDFFENHSWETTRGGYRFIDSFYGKVVINFTLGETKTYYSVYHNRVYDYTSLWLERWYSELFGKPLKENDYYSEMNAMGKFGKLIGGGTIEELDILLRPYINSMDVEQFDGYHSGDYILGGFVKIWLLIPYNYNRETVLTIRDDFVNFFGNNRQELIEKYGQFNTININFYRMEDIIYRITDRKQMVVKTEIEVYQLLYENNEWLERWESERDYKPLGENSILME